MMNIYWSATQIPELAGLSANQRKQMIRRFCFNDRIMLFFRLLIWGVLVGLGRKLADSLQFGVFGSLICCAVAGAIAGFITCAIGMARIRPRMRQYLEQNGEELKTV